MRGISNNTGDVFHTILCKMFEIVGLEFDVDLIKNERWFSENEWSLYEQKTFINWAIFHLQKELHCSRSNAEDQVLLFLFNNSWNIGFRPEIRHGLVTIGLTKSNKYKILKR